MPKDQTKSSDSADSLHRAGSDAVVWEKSRFKGGVKWVCWKMSAWVTARKNEPLHIGLGQKYLGTWDCAADEAKQKLERMYRGHMAALN